LVPAAIGSITHAITIRGDRRALWPWLAQMGAGRAGWYSCDLIDNGRRRSADRIRPELLLGHFIMQRKQLLGIAARAEPFPAGTRLAHPRQG
jgi:hypothetical protein